MQKAPNNADIDKDWQLLSCKDDDIKKPWNSNNKHLI